MALAAQVLKVRDDKIKYDAVSTGLEPTVLCAATQGTSFVLVTDIDGLMLLIPHEAFAKLLT